MKFYLSQEYRKILIKHYRHTLEFRRTCVIDIEQMKFKMNYKNTIYHNFLLFENIKKLIKNSVNSKRINAILYIIKEINTENISSIKEFIGENQLFINEFILIDFSENVDRKLYTEFDKII